MIFLNQTNFQQKLNNNIKVFNKKYHNKNKNLIIQNQWFDSI